MEVEKKMMIGTGGIIALALMIGAIVSLLPKPKPPEVPPVDEPPPSETPAGIVYSMLIVTPPKVYLGESVEISVKATNTGATTAEYDLYLGPDTGLTAHVVVAPGETKTYSWAFTPTQTGIYDVWADSLHSMFEVTTVEEEATMPLIYGTILYTVSDWIVYEASDGRGRVYRYSAPWSVVELWIELDGVHRLQLRGSSPFGVWPEHHVFLVGSYYYDPYVAMFRYMDAGCPQGYRSEGWWEGQVNYCQFHPPGTPKWDELDDLNKYFCSFSPYTRP